MIAARHCCRTGAPYGLDRSTHAFSGVPLSEKQRVWRQVAGSVTRCIEVHFT